MKTDYTYRDHEIHISIHHDEHMGPPWKEHDGHGVVSEWERRDKRPGELLLNKDRSSSRFYDLEDTLKIAKRDGWGLSDEDKAAFTDKLGRSPTKREVIAESVRRDYEHLRGWCNDEWHWQGYTTEIVTPDARAIAGGSCWGFDDEAYMVSEARSEAESQVDELISTAEQTKIAECYP